MSWLATRRPRTAALALVLGLVGLVATAGCDDLDGRARNRKGNRMFRDGHFIDAVVLYEQALKKVQDPRIEYNIGLAYSRVFKGTDEPVLLGEKSETVCTTIPGATAIKRSVCVKKNADEEDRSYPACKSQDDCPSSAICKIDLEMCAVSNEKLAELTQQHLTKWIATQPPDDEIRKRGKELTAELTRIEEKRDAADARAESLIDPTTGKTRDGYAEAVEERTSAERDIKALKDEIDENDIKFTMRTLMTNVLVDSGQPDKALEYWAGELKARPGDFEAMGKLAGINLKAGNWRKAIEWYTTIAEKVPEPSNKVNAYSSIGNVAWAKLNSKTLPPDQAVQLADLGIGALQKATALVEKNPQFLRLESSLLGFRSRVHGVSWAAAIDRATAQDRKLLSDVVSGKKVKPPTGGAAPAPAPKDPTPAPKKAGG